MVEVTLNILKAISPNTKVTILQNYVEPLNAVLEHFGMTENPKRVAAFLAQVAHESGDFNFIKENLNYSATSLTKVFKTYFPTTESTQGYARNPEKIANRVYANRMGNGTEASGDGYKFCGRGLIQITGKNNYTAFSNSISLTITDTIKYLETNEGATVSAGWFWDINKLNIYADKEDFTGLTRRINGGTIGLEDRLQHYKTAMSMFT